MCVQERGEALIGSAHGSFSSLLCNKELKGLLGGGQPVVLGDAAAKDNKGKKVGGWVGEAGVRMMMWIPSSSHPGAYLCEAGIR